MSVGRPFLTFFNATELVTNALSLWPRNVILRFEQIIVKLISLLNSAPRDCPAHLKMRRMRPIASISSNWPILVVFGCPFQ
jgi:hypothetical protein